MPAAPAEGLGPVKSPEETDEIAGLLEMAVGTRPSPEAVEAFCLAVVLAMQKHEGGEY